MNPEEQEAATPVAIAKIVLLDDGDIEIEWPYATAQHVPVDRSEAVTKAAWATLQGWNPA